jgi:hypothetical protein
MIAQRGKQHWRIRHRLVDEPMSVGNLHAAERLFAKLAGRMILCNTSETKLAGLYLHRCNGRALTPRKGDPATIESEREHYAHTNRGI